MGYLLTWKCIPNNMIITVHKKKLITSKNPNTLNFGYMTSTFCQQSNLITWMIIKNSCKC